MTNKEIAELTTRILENAVANPKGVPPTKWIYDTYEQIFQTIKKMDSGEN